MRYEILNNQAEDSEVGSMIPKKLLSLVRKLPLGKMLSIRRDLGSFGFGSKNLCVSVNLERMGFGTGSTPTAVISPLYSSRNFSKRLYVAIGKVLQSKTTGGGFRRL